MSAFIVDKKTIDRVLTFLNRMRSSNTLGATIVKSVLREHKTKIETDEDLTFMGNALLLMNKQAVDYRYSRISLIQEYKYEVAESSNVQVLKSMKCLKYQCTEGDIDKLKLYKFLQDLEKALMVIIIDSIPEYNEAEWG